MILKVVQWQESVYKDIIFVDYFCFSVVFTCEVVSVWSVKCFPDKQSE